VDGGGVLSVRDGPGDRHPGPTSTTINAIYSKRRPCTVEWFSLSGPSFYAESGSVNTLYPWISPLVIGNQHHLIFKTP